MAVLGAQGHRPVSCQLGRRRVWRRSVIVACAWLVRNEVAHILKFSPKTLANWASARPPRGPRFFKIGGQCRYRAADVLDWQDRQLSEESAQPQGW